MVHQIININTTITTTTFDVQIDVFHLVIF